MRLATFKIRLIAILGLMLVAQPVLSIDTSNEEATCVEIGFKKKTPAFGDCVLTLVERRASVAVNASDPDHATCIKYGYKASTNEYAMCRQQIDIARQDAKRQNELQREQNSRAVGAALFSLGTGMMANSAPRQVPQTQNDFSRTYNLPGGRSMRCTTTGTVTNCY
jgi:hypothetical protein